MYQRQLTFSEAIDCALKCNYLNFSGRAALSDFWWFMLFSLLTFFTSVFVVGVLGEVAAYVVGALVLMFLMLPMLSMAVRRLHDVNRSGWWLPLAVTGIGLLPLLVWFCTGSYMDYNRYGDIPNMID